MRDASQTKENFSGNYAELPHVLLVDDDRRIRELLARYLGEQGYMVMSASDAAEARSILQDYAFDVLVVDVMMPGQSGLDFTKELREASSVPVLMLTALGETDDRIAGLESGADDYLAKPFEPRELLLRINAIVRRTARPSKSDTSIRIGPWIFDQEVEMLRNDAGETVKLSGAESALISVLLGRPGEVFSREELARGCGLDAGERTIDVQITRLRRKVEPDSKNPRYILTLRGRGYMLRTQEG